MLFSIRGPRAGPRFSLAHKACLTRRVMQWLGAWSRGHIVDRRCSSARYQRSIAAITFGSRDSLLDRDYGLADLDLQPGEIDAAVLVQAAPTEAETRFLLDTAGRSSGFVRGIVGWVDLEIPDAAGRIEALVRQPLVKGLRPMLGFIEDTGWILRREIRPALDAMAKAGLSLDFPARVRHLDLLPELASRHPNLAVIIDHAAKPRIVEEGFEIWAEGMTRIARLTRSFCKISGLLSEAAPGWRADDLWPFVDRLLDCFGPDRLMWGSDWPVVELAGGNRRWREAALELIPMSVRQAVMGGTAAKCYRF
jgi:L-fuconolactonase